MKTHDQITTAITLNQMNRYIFMMSNYKIYRILIISKTFSKIDFRNKNEHKFIYKNID